MVRRTWWAGIFASTALAPFLFSACGAENLSSMRSSGLGSAANSADGTSFNQSIDLTSGTVTTMAPSAIQVKRGTVSKQSLSVLAKKEQSGTADDWNTYLEFAPASTGSAAVFTFTVPSTVNVSSITSIKVLTNYKGPGLSTQQWSFLLYDYAAGKWVSVGTNSLAGTWTWTSFDLTATGILSRFISTTKKVSLRYETSTAVDSSDIDYLVVNVEAGVTPSPTPTPSASPTPSPSPSASPTPTPTPPVSGSWWKPAIGTSWQMQYSGTIDTSLNVQAYMLDMFGTSATTISALHARGVKVICYIDGGSWESYTPDAANFPASIIGNAIGGWPDEKWLDIRSKTLLWPIMRARLDLAKQKGCDGIYHDWADSYAGDTGFPLTAQDQLVYNRDFWVVEAHARGLSVGLINDLVQIKDLVAYYDWAMNESCSAYNECGYMKPFIDAKKPVFSLNYTGDTSTVCAALNALNFDAIFKDVNLGAYRLPCR